MKCVQWVLVNQPNVVATTIEGIMSDPILISEDVFFVIDTDSHVDDFVSHLVAYCTGLTNEEDEDNGCSNMFYMEMDIEDDEEGTAFDKNPFNEYIVDKPTGSEGAYSPWGFWLSRTWGENEKGDYAKLTPDNCNEYGFPAPFSCCIFFDVEPTIEQIEIIKERAEKFFVKMWPNMKENTSGKEVKIEGFRLIQHKKYGEEKSL